MSLRVCCWGGRSGGLGGGFWGVGRVVWQQYGVQMRPLNEFAGLLLGVAIVAAGVGAIGGVVSGGLLGLCGFSPKLPISFQPSGVRGGALGAVWGGFLGASAGAGGGGGAAWGVVCVVGW